MFREVWNDEVSSIYRDILSKSTRGFFPQCWRILMFFSLFVLQEWRSRGLGNRKRRILMQDVESDMYCSSVQTDATERHLSYLFGIHLLFVRSCRRRPVEIL